MLCTRHHQRALGLKRGDAHDVAVEGDAGLLRVNDDTGGLRGLDPLTDKTPSANRGVGGAVVEDRLEVLQCDSGQKPRRAHR